MIKMIDGYDFFPDNDDLLLLTRNVLLDFPFKNDLGVDFLYTDIIEGMKNEKF